MYLKRLKIVLSEFYLWSASGSVQVLIQVDKRDYFQNGSQEFFFSFMFKFLFIFLNMKPLSEVAPDLLVIQIQIQAVWYSWMLWNERCIVFIML